MDAQSVGRLNWPIALKLGRISNLPTVWSNVLVGVILAGGSIADRRLPLLLLAFSLFYAGGMFLNDWFDRDYDTRHRPERPIPSGQVSASVVLRVGLAMPAAGLAILSCVGWYPASGTGAWPFLYGTALCGAILLYDSNHKDNPLSPLIMGLCRMLVYLTAAISVVSSLPTAVLLAAGSLLCYLIGLTYIAKQETLGRVRNLWPLLFFLVPMLWSAKAALDSVVGMLLALLFAAWILWALSFLMRRRPGDVPRAVVSLIAGISLLDAVLLSAHGAVAAAFAALGAFALTLALQRFVPGT